MTHRMLQRVGEGCLVVALVVIGSVAGAEEPSGMYDSGPQRPTPSADRRSSSKPERPDMGPMMDDMMQQGIRHMAAGMAVFARAYYLALMDQGFSPEEALKLVEAAGLPPSGSRF
ncbi:MAG: hypothetical protein HY600_01300 [Candidatus Omnitrophica bacterium]|nr:hypothetical protein [Candidatus Omnitrophota bacterium]